MKIKSICGRKFTDTHVINQHKKQYHDENVKNYQCSNCPYECLSSANLKKHILIHDESREKNVDCDTCDKKLYTEADMKRHMEVHSEFRETYRCDQCDVRFTSKNWLEGQHSITQ